ncbi:hypothetical protein ACFWVU_20215 [Streptomyces sp. NPDC058686]|uniref:hypothetical protein n=1 Tax=Streptomyces sp. NPDC058686 TaxID=3346599 RepID=UPI00364733F4
MHKLETRTAAFWLQVPRIGPVRRIGRIPVLPPDGVALAAGGESLDGDTAYELVAMVRE